MRYAVIGPGTIGGGDPASEDSYLSDNKGSVVDIFYPADGPRSMME